MSTSIKILKEHLDEHPALGVKLNLLCVKVRDEVDACIYTLHPGVLMIFLKLVSEHRISYETVYEENQT